MAAVVNGPPGQQKLKVGKHEVTLTVNDANQVVDSKTKKPNIWGKIGKIALTVASFVPGPVGIAARIASSVISAAEGIKNKNWVQACYRGCQRRRGRCRCDSRQSSRGSGSHNGARRR